MKKSSYNNFEDLYLKKNKPFFKYSQNKYFSKKNHSIKSKTNSIISKNLQEKITFQQKPCSKNNYKNEDTIDDEIFSDILIDLDDIQMEVSNNIEDNFDRKKENKYLAQDINFLKDEGPFINNNKTNKILKNKICLIESSKIHKLSFDNKEFNNTEKNKDCYLLNQLGSANNEKLNKDSFLEIIDKLPNNMKDTFNILPFKLSSNYLNNITNKNNKIKELTNINLNYQNNLDFQNFNQISINFNFNNYNTGNNININNLKPYLDNNLCINVSNFNFYGKTIKEKSELSNQSFIKKKRARKKNLNKFIKNARSDENLPKNDTNFIELDKIKSNFNINPKKIFTIKKVKKTGFKIIPSHNMHKDPISIRDKNKKNIRKKNIKKSNVNNSKMLLRKKKKGAKEYDLILLK